MAGLVPWLRRERRSPERQQCLRGEGNLAAAIGYYRADEPGLRDFAADGAYAAEEQAPASGGPQPTLYLHGNRDGCIDLSLVQDAGRHLAAGSRMEAVEGGHFLQVEKLASVNDRMACAAPVHLAAPRD